MGKRSIIYIDGFNLYYGMLKSSKFKWLDLQKFFETVREDDDIQKVNYFTAEVLSKEKKFKQAAYLNALQMHCPKVNIIRGKYRLKEAIEYKTNNKVVVPEEKMTDVNIAVQMLVDAYEDRADRFILVTGDSDLVPAVKQIRKMSEDKKRVIVYVPAESDEHPRAEASELRGASYSHRTLKADFFKKSQLPNPVTDGTIIIPKPYDW